MKSKMIMIPALAGLLCSGLWAQAQKIAVVDMQSAMAATKDGQKANAELQKIYGPKEQDFQKRAQEIQTKSDQLKKTQNTMSDAARAAAQDDIDRLSKKLQQDEEDAQTDADQDQQKYLQDIGTKMVQVISKYATEKGYSMVFDVSGQPTNLVFAATPAPQTQSEQPEASAPQGNLPDAAPEQGSSMPQPAGQQQ